MAGISLLKAVQDDLTLVYDTIQALAPYATRDAKVRDVITRIHVEQKNLQDLRDIITGASTHERNPTPQANKP